MKRLHTRTHTFLFPRWRSAYNLFKTFICVSASDYWQSLQWLCCVSLGWGEWEQFHCKLNCWQSTWALVAGNRGMMEIRASLLLLDSRMWRMMRQAVAAGSGCELRVWKCGAADLFLYPLEVEIKWKPRDRELELFGLWQLFLEQ